MQAQTYWGVHFLASHAVLVDYQGAAEPVTIPKVNEHEPPPSITPSLDLPCFGCLADNFHKHIIPRIRQQEIRDRFHRADSDLQCSQGRYLTFRIGCKEVRMGLRNTSEEHAFLFSYSLRPKSKSTMWLRQEKTRQMATHRIGIPFRSP